MANDDAKLKYNMDNLEKLIRSLKTDYVLRVGVLGSKAKGQHDEDSGKTNADIGTFHEFGTKKMARRSFLENSLKFKLKFNAEQFRDMRKILFKQIFDKNAPEKFLQDLGAKCLEIIEEGFETNGFGMWEPLKTREIREQRDADVLSTIAKLNRSANRLEGKMKTWEDYDKWNRINDRIKKLKTNFIEYGSKILTDTGKLRHSISFKVVKKK